MRDDIPAARVSALEPLDIDHYPIGPATWEMAGCLRCGKECIFSDGICAPCWRVYQEEVA